jgi:hypothetical protein
MARQADADSNRTGPPATSAAGLPIDPAEAVKSSAGPDVQAGQSKPANAGWQATANAAGAELFDASANADRIARAIAAQLRGRAGGLRDGSIRLHLEPPGLGQMRIEMSLSSDSVRLSVAGLSVETALPAQPHRAEAGFSPNGQDRSGEQSFAWHGGGGQREGSQDGQQGGGDLDQSSGGGRAGAGGAAAPPSLAASLGQLRTTRVEQSLDLVG